MSLTYGEMFAGYGGLGMGVQSVLGGHMAWCAEIDHVPAKILAHHWPDQLKALGNGVVPQQAAAATRAFLEFVAGRWAA